MRFSPWLTALAVYVSAGISAATGLAPGASAATTASCGALRIKAQTSATLNQTTSAAYVNVPGSGFSFTVQGTTPSCVLVTFSGTMNMLFGEALWVKPLLDGSVTAAPGEMILHANSDVDDSGQSIDSGSATFLFAGIAPGLHTLTFQYKSDTGTNIQLFNFALLAQFR